MRMQEGCQSLRWHRCWTEFNFAWFR